MFGFEETAEYLSSNKAEIVYLIRIFVACLCGGAIGIERTLRQKDAGFRTHFIVALGSALLTIVSKYGFFDIMNLGFGVDTSRVAANIITSMGFLGAGMIFVKGANIKGLTTAAGIWSTSAVGMAIGCGMYITGIVSTVLIIIIQIVFHTFLVGYDKILANDITYELVIRLENVPGAIEHFKEVLNESGVHTSERKIALGNDNVFTITLTIKSDEDIDIEKLVALFNSTPGIKAISL